jgi:flagellin
MALAIATNTAALNAAASASSVNRDMETSMARLSTGKRINSASDDAAGVAISSRLSSEIRGTDQAVRNALDGQALIDTAEGAHKEIENILQRMREIAVQAANDTNNAQDRSNLQAEMNAMGTEIDRIAGTTTWAGANLMQGSSTSFSFQVGSAVGAKNQIAVTIGGMKMSDLSIGSSTTTAAFTIDADDFGAVSALGDTTNGDWSITAVTASTTEAPDTLTFTPDVLSTGTSAGSVSITHPGTGDVFTAEVVGGSPAEISKTVENMNAAFGSLGVVAVAANDTTITMQFKEVAEVTTPATSISVASGTDARTGITALDAAIKEVNVQRSTLGAVSNRLNHTVNNLTNISSNLSAAKGGIEDADFALETTNLAKNQILQQASTAMLAQANASKQNVLSLLQG